MSVFNFLTLSFVYIFAFLFCLFMGFLGEHVFLTIYVLLIYFFLFSVCFILFWFVSFLYLTFFELSIWKSLPKEVILRGVF